MMSTIVLAALGGLAATTTTAVATGDASAVAAAVHVIPPGLHVIPPGLHVALSHVPSASNAYDVLKAHLSLYTGTGGAGTAAGGAAAAVSHGLRLGLGK